MDNYLEKCFELHNQGKTVKEIIENIYINYSAFNNNDKIYEFKKVIASNFHVSLKDIKLIGSSHTHFSSKGSGLHLKESSEDINDYDFAIINASTFNYFWSELLQDINQIKKESKKTFFGYLSNGKIHPLYLKDDSKTYKEITSKVGVIECDKKVSVCIYAFEEAFIQSLCSYLEKDLIKYFKEAQETINIQPVSTDGIKTLNSMGDKLNGR